MAAIIIEISENRLVVIGFIIHINNNSFPISNFKIIYVI